MKQRNDFMNERTTIKVNENQEVTISGREFYEFFGS